MKPTEFTNRIGLTITSQQARGILSEMGINIPKNISIENLSEILRTTPKLTQSQIETFYKQATKLAGGN